MDLREVLHQLIDYGGGRWDDEDGRRGSDAHEAVDRYFVRPDPPATTPGTRTDRSGSWLPSHGEDLIAVKVIDLLSAVARMEQVLDAPEEHPFRSIIEERIYTCDLPRLRWYLPAGALKELSG
jgi:hypothetical protein